MTLYVLRNKETGEYWRRGSSRKQWNLDITKATVYTKVGAAKTACTNLVYYGFNTVEVVILSATVTGVIK